MYFYTCALFYLFIYLFIYFLPLFWLFTLNYYHDIVQNLHDPIDAHRHYTPLNFLHGQLYKKKQKTEELCALN